MSITGYVANGVLFKAPGSHSWGYYPGNSHFVNSRLFVAFHLKMDNTADGVRDVMLLDTYVQPRNQI